MESWMQKVWNRAQNQVSRTSNLLKNDNSKNDLIKTKIFILVEIVNMTSWPDSGWERCWWVATWPINACLLITIPDCRRPSLRNWYPLTFAMCIVWIAVMSYVVGWDITIIGKSIKN